MSRAFVREDAGPPEPDAVGQYRAYEDKVVGFLPAHSDDDFLTVLHWVLARPNGCYQVRDANGVLLAEIGMALNQ